MVSVFISTVINLKSFQPRFLNREINDDNRDARSRLTLSISTKSFKTLPVSEVTVTFQCSEAFRESDEITRGRTVLLLFLFVRAKRTRR